MTIEELLAREGIRDTLARYHAAGDRGRIDELVPCFTADGVLEIEGEPPLVGRDAIGARLRAVAEAHRAASASLEPDGRALLRHHLTTAHIEPSSPDAARAWSYFVAISGAGLDHAGRYADRFRRSGDLWLLAYRRVAVDWWAADSRFRPGA